MLSKLSSFLVTAIFFVLSPTLAQAQTNPLSFQMPHQGRITTYFSSSHPGIDLATPFGTDIRPITEGVVTQAGKNNTGLGLMVELEHNGGYKSIYGHMSRIDVTVGQTVIASTILGKVGLTGHTTGPHTHLEILKDSRHIDPLTILPRGKINTLARASDNATGGPSNDLAQLPRTGLWEGFWLGALFLPLGWILITRNRINKSPLTPNYIWLKRNLSKG